MAPGRIDSPTENVHLFTTSKATVYLLDTFHPTALKHAQAKFNAILPSDPKHSHWRENAEYLLIRGSYLTRQDIDSCPRLKAIGKQGVGIDKLDATACQERGIPIFNTPGVNAQAVAETVLSLTMSVARQVGRVTALQTQGKVVPKESCSGLIIRNKTIGIVGMGNIGHKVAKIFQAGLGCKIVAYDPLLPRDAWADTPHTRAETLEEILDLSDVVTLHIPLLPQTRGLISYSQLMRMKRNAILINTARGGIVNEADLERALEEQLIFGAGLDCHEQEPPTKERYGNLWATGRVRLIGWPIL
ncbi:D-isomer specific 2-hydroxyacid dehydrogenase [Boeremia exigua]|uniref:D-isomer specific 2-hydroxyacid dehydrogenase n=1 Tax=Boeremia exigua TaxID=749465 RepID=UPI001E8DE950|nr:D-isomer specific 2-hydroxyacid dehydrogenase [Boeremia exigua]KAH6639838.1 D-isomer specific 2-hydroxyacid dehydrogenase [Boeremia exigua]